MPSFISEPVGNCFYLVHSLTSIISSGNIFFWKPVSVITYSYILLLSSLCSSLCKTGPFSAMELPSGASGHSVIDVTVAVGPFGFA